MNDRNQLVSVYIGGKEIITYKNFQGKREKRCEAISAHLSLQRKQYISGPK